VEEVAIDPKLPDPDLMPMETQSNPV